jgi:hypothetical protein
LAADADYTFKYSNQLDPLSSGEQCKVVMFMVRAPTAIAIEQLSSDCAVLLAVQVLPGKSLHVPERKSGLKPTEGYDSHRSSNYQEWCVLPRQ